MIPGGLSWCATSCLCVQQMIQTTRANPVTFLESGWLIPSFLEERHCRKYSVNLVRKARFELWFDFMKPLEATGSMKYCHSSAFLLLLPHPRSCSGRTVSAAFCELGTAHCEKTPRIKKFNKTFLVRMAPWETKPLIHKSSMLNISSVLLHFCHHHIPWRVGWMFSVFLKMSNSLLK